MCAALTPSIRAKRVLSVTDEEPYSKITRLTRDCRDLCEQVDRLEGERAALKKGITIVQLVQTS